MATLNQRQKRQTYWDSGRMSPALLRARAPFRSKNLLTGAGIVSFTFGVYFYSIAAVKQDDFSDVPAPSLEEIEIINQKHRSEHENLEKDLIKDEKFLMKKTIGTTKSLSPIGLFGSVSNLMSGKGNSRDWQIIHGAPPVDSIGSISDRKVSDNEEKQV
ncbi:hypothetical protein BY996DRAFT_6420672 [Phakopsora pachyrhizi]|nr:hypothetical protein BY996DRAFT_6420672 [Phakopsora pachyrhizi]